MHIQWYPGHMARARRMVEENLKLVDVIVELVDARVPVSSRNPAVAEITAGRPRLVVLNKVDLADRELTAQWLAELGRREKVVAVDSRTGKGSGKIPGLVAGLARSRKKYRGGPVRCMVIGIPNVGKSSFINRLAGRKAAPTGKRPGVTKGKQWIRLNKSVELLDTPGILWPKFDDPQVGYRLAAVGAIKEDVYEVGEVALWLVNWLEEHYPGTMEKRYGLPAPPMPGEEILTAVGEKRGFVSTGGKIDVHKAAIHVIKEFREGKLGYFTLDLPPHKSEKSS